MISWMLGEQQTIETQCLLIVMDASDNEYQRIVNEAVMRLIVGVDCSDQHSSVAAQLQVGLIRLQEADFVRDRELCTLILRASDSPVAQSYRNIRQTNTNDRRWAGLALSYDVQETVLKELPGGRFDHHEVGTRVWAWQRQALRGNFADDTPWCVIADWFDDLGDSRKANLCRELEAARE